jgi:hypothetical protein
MGERMNNYLNYIFAAAIIVTILLFLPDYSIPVPKESLMEAIGQLIISCLSVGIVLNELIKEANKK